jgi:hypothetical protein
MRCRTCNYALWNLNNPQCPECGTEFDLRSYRFTPGTVAFGCPHCGALHGGAGPNYLPAETDTATCQSCSQTMTVTNMAVVPLSDDATAESGMTLPWEQRSELGLFTAWWKTCILTMTDPAQVGRSLSDSTSFWTAYWFAAMTYLLGGIVNAVVMGTCFGALYLAMSTGGPMGPGAPDPNEMLFNAIVQVVMVPFSLLIPFFLVGITGGAAHLVLMITGARKSGFQTTAVTMLYGQGPMLLYLIPACGYYIGAVWALVATILILMRTQDVSGFRATLAMLILPILGTLFFCAILGTVIALLPTF